VSQHLTKSLVRDPGKDFRVPSDDELDALLAYQLSLGQQVSGDMRNPSGSDIRNPATPA